MYIYVILLLIIYYDSNIIKVHYIRTHIVPEYLWPVIRNAMCMTAKKILTPPLLQHTILQYTAYMCTILRRHLTKVKTCFQERKEIKTDDRKRRPVVVKQPRALSEMRKKMHIHAKGRVYYIIWYLMCLLPIWYYYYYYYRIHESGSQRLHFWIKYIQQYHTFSDSH